MIAKTFLLVASAALALGSPCSPPPPAPTLPSAGGATELPPPAAGLTLKKIALGLGIQNYTCASVGATAASTGALAMFYDITDLYPGQSRKSLTMDKFNDLPAFALHHHQIPLHFNSSTAGRVDPKDPGADLHNPFTADAPLELPGYQSLPFLGHHFFSASGDPIFNLENGAIFVDAAKVASVAAPSTADAGLDKTGAVAWLGLSAKAGSKGASFVYRVETAGGNSHGCAKSAGQDTDSYSAQYWFFG